MFRITRKPKVAVFAVLVAAAAVMAGSARASSALIDVDSVPTIGGSSFSFNYGMVDWWLGDGRFNPDLSGTLNIDNANGSCARMRLEYFSNNVSIAVKYGGTVCAPDGGSHAYSVDLDPYSDARIDLLKVSVEKKTASGGSDFSIVESAYVAPQTSSDSIEIDSGGVDFGGGKFSTILAEPTEKATMYWNRGSGADYTPRLMGYIWLNNVAGLCARMNLRYYTESGSFLAEKHGGSGCAADNNLHAISVDLQPYTTSQLGKVVVQLQTQGSNGSWNLVGSDTATIDQFNPS